MADNCYCERCKKTIRDTEFYTSNNREKYPNDGKVHMCKKCMCAHVDYNNSETYLWILQELDVPYVPDEWYRVIASQQKTGRNFTGLTIVGKYLSKMKLKQFKDYRWKDTEFLQEQAKVKTQETMRNNGYSAAEIAAVVNTGAFAPPPADVREPDYAIAEPAQPQPPVQDYFAAQQEMQDELESDLTPEDRRYLLMKWGKTYRPDEWIQLEQLYEEMCQSYDIQTAGHIDTLKFVCKTSLKANQLLDIGD